MFDPRAFAGYQGRQRVETGMIYETAKEWLEAPEKRVALFGMSGLGKTHVSNILRAGGGWFHYSVDYRIGSRYLIEEINDNLKREAMKNPFLADLLRSDSIDITARLRFQNLAPLSAWLGKPGDPARGGLPIGEYRHRQALHREAEIAAMRDSPRFIARARALYGYPHFVCDTSGSFCEVVDPADPADPVLEAMTRHMLLVWIEGGEEHAEKLIERFRAAPKPMYYPPALLDRLWQEYINENNVEEGEVDPDDFAVFAFSRAIRERQPRYRAIAESRGVRVSADDMATVRDEADFNAVIADALMARAPA